MRRGISVLSITVILITGVLFLLLQAGDGDKMNSNGKTISGTIVDSKCYAMGGFLTDDHKDMKGNNLPKCGTACASLGIPVAIVDEDNNVYVLAVSATGMAKYMAQKVRVHGMFGKYANVFIPQKLEIREDGKWVEKPLPGSMM
ncbi:MAG: hypothetical protein D6748_06235 [Calditrichaeota bacterium]|nr:MAG: hypothetical protein D6748_06235 [Calditrichota bacterium]